MDKESFRGSPDVRDDNYDRYLELGGIINKDDYKSALKRAGDNTKPEKALISQAENIAAISGIELHGTEDNPDERVRLYAILRKDVRPEGVKHHHDEMSDQRIFMEVLRMLGDAESMDKMIKRHPHISFDYGRSE